MRMWSTACATKLIYRHPHVYGDIHADTPDDVKRNWEALKLRKEKNRRSGTLGGVPVGLPAMVKARCASAKRPPVRDSTGERREGVWAKVREETAGSRDRNAPRRSRSDGRREFGDLFFALVNASPALRSRSRKPHSNAPTASSSAASPRWRKPPPDRGVCSPI